MALKVTKPVARLSPYVTTPQDPWRSPHRYEICKLDWNEGKGVPRSLRRLMQSLVEEDATLNWYPDAEAVDLTAAIARSLKVPASHVLTFPGSDVALDTACRAFLADGSLLLMPVPGYDNFRVFAESVGCRVVPWAVSPPFQFDVRALADAIRTSGAGAVYLSNPNNPCGYVVAAADLLRLAAEFSEIAFFIDEAYVDFCPEYSCVPRIGQAENVVIFRTFSKAYGLAGLRLGYLVSAPENIRNLQKLRNGKNISRLAQEAGITLLSEPKDTLKAIAEVTSTRRYLERELAARGARVFPGAANFLLMEVDGARELAGGLKRYGVYVRDRSGMIPDCMRVTITDMADGVRLLTAIDRYRREG